MSIIKGDGYIEMDNRIYFEILPYHEIITSKQNEALILRFLNNRKRTYKNIGELMNISTTFARVLVEKALRKLRRYYAPKRTYLNLNKKQIILSLSQDEIDSNILYNKIFTDYE